MQTYTVPVDVYSINIKCWGAEGFEGGAAAAGASGLGGYAEGNLIVSPGEILNIFVGGHGGYNGGGAAGELGAGNGGGASDVRQGGIGTLSRVIVAGGGGGGGMIGCPAEWEGGDGGAGGGVAGGDGQDSEAGGGGLGGTVGTGGAAGIGCDDFLGFPGGDDGVGGDGYAFGCFMIPGGGGGGGGYIVGGGGGGGSTGTVGCLGDSKGGGGGGAGGSSYAGPLYDVVFEDGIRLLNGQITIEPLECDTLDVTVSAYDICLGESITLSAAGAGAIIWDGGIINGVPFTPLTAGENVFIATSDADGDCGFAVLINVVDLPVVALADFTDICEGDSVILTGEGADEYAWDPDDVVDGEPFVPGVGVITFTVVGTDLELGCENTDEIDITVHALPMVEAITTEEVVCLGESLTLTGEGADEYFWDPEEIEDGEPYTPLETGTLTFIVTGLDDETACENTAEVEIVVFALPEVIASASEEEICFGEELTLTGEGADIYEWFPGFVVDGEAFIPDAGVVSYLVVGVDEETGCENSASVSVTIYELPEVIANASDNEICLGDELTLFGSGAAEYIWDPDTVEDGESFTPDATGITTYSVTGIDDNGCVNDGTIVVTVFDALEITYTVTDEIDGGDGSIDITVTGGNPPYVFDWDNDGTGDFDDTEDLTGLTEDSYMVIVECSAGCMVTETMLIDSQVGILELINSPISVYPNPTNDLITIAFLGSFKYELTSANGEILLTGKGADSQLIDLTEFATGIYFIKVYNNSERSIVKILKK